jgi:uncharacterized surface protein with fasciclin (FAS1) repeats
MKNTAGTVSSLKRVQKSLIAVTVIAAGLTSALANADESRTIAQIAVETPSLSTLVTALKTADLVATLNSPNSKFTVFAPSNDAFGLIPSATLNALLAAPHQLKTVLLYHVISGVNYNDSSRLLGEEFVRTATGFGLKFKRPAGDLYVNNAKLASQFDSDSVKRTVRIEASNGSIYLIDRVLLPADGSLYAK